MKKKNKFPIPENILELMFGAGASVVIIGALLKITHNEFIFSGNTWLTVGLVTESIIFLISGLRGFVTLRGISSGVSDEDVSDLSGIAQEAHALKLAYQNATKKLHSLDSNLSNALGATSTFEVPLDLPKNINNLNTNVAHTNEALKQLSLLYSATTDAISTEPLAHTQVIQYLNSLQNELAALKKTTSELNSKYADILGAMKN